ncbi:hypothetical protein D5R93_02310 [Actinomyces lilanjuaniae]|uniref:Uncharacterized protein n=1 Tax=Actinomyces lilanjuaniae TaxID=2321394 RepID=A0ABN5PRI0_9ACTO|nr:hypothetical protein D5R93_02310 [Actinomyces lilanjuaniae]
MSRPGREGRRGTLLVAVVAVAVVVAVVAVAAVVLRGQASREGRPAGSPEQTSEEVSLDEVVPGSGSLRESEHVPGVRVGYEATCPGAGQAVAGWTEQVLGGVTTQNAAAGAGALEALLEEEVLSPTWERVPGAGDSDPVRTVVAAAETYEEEGEAAEPEPVNRLRAEWGAWRLLACEEGSSAEVELYAPLETNGWRGATPRSREPAEQLLFYRFALVAAGGEWRVESLTDVAAEETSDHGGQLDFLEPYGDRAFQDGTFLTAGAQDSLMGVLGTGAHRYVAG